MQALQLDLWGFEELQFCLKLYLIVVLKSIFFSFLYLTEQLQILILDKHRFTFFDTKITIFWS